MNLGCFSISLTVKDIAKSKHFYEALGFTVYHGMEDQGWLIMKNGETNIGLFQGMIDNNIMTFNPGWNQDAQPMEPYDDVRKIQESLKAAGLTLDSEVEQNTQGPGSLSITDPDGNQILLDQHV
jgi:catechol 2,3-dioxygenase-like lactoylglutathione lyase family enzyme